MFNFLDMIGNHDDRKVDTYNKDGLFIDTCLVTDASEPYETAVQHKNYNEGSIVIVEMYHTLNDAEKGHKKWVKKMTAKKLPETLIDVGTSEISQFCDEVEAGTEWRTVKAKGK